MHSRHIAVDAYGSGKYRPAMAAEIRAGIVADFEDGVRRLITHENRTIGVFAHDGEFHAYLNVCPHQGGPVCEGVIVAKVETVVNPDGSGNAGRFSDSEAHLVCPWHGVEFDLRTGRCWSDERLKLRAFEVVTRDDEVFVRV
jgi:nitrite reductase/ring-hydroxylating ferredoxin subunit